MGLLEFQKLPVNTLVGADWKTFKEITKGQKIEKGYKTKYCLTKSVCWLLSSLHNIQDRRYTDHREREIRTPQRFFLHTQR